ncbi:hypothetical protein Tco_1199788 [Tanacetum coccineum]
MSKEKSYFVRHDSINDESYNFAVILLGLCSIVCYRHSQYGSNQEENKIDVARYAEFLEKNLICQDVSRRAVELEEIQNEDKSPSKHTSKIPTEVEGFKPPREEIAHVRRSIRTHQAPECSCINVEVDEHSLTDLNETANYKATLLDHEYISGSML